MDETQYFPLHGPDQRDTIVPRLRARWQRSMDNAGAAESLDREAADEIERLRAIVENVAGLDCADGYSMSDNEWIKFWCVLQDAREAAGE